MHSFQKINRTLHAYKTNKVENVYRVLLLPNQFNSRQYVQHNPNDIIGSFVKTGKTFPIQIQLFQDRYHIFYLFCFESIFPPFFSSIFAMKRKVQLHVEKKGIKFQHFTKINLLNIVYTTKFLNPRLVFTNVNTIFLI